MVTVVASFYAPRPRHPGHVYDYLDCLAVQRDSCKRFGCRQLVITDAPALRDLPTFHAELQQELMPAILAGQLALLESGIADDLVLIGADGLLGRDPAALFDATDADDRFDLGVTTHPFADCILNTGLIAVPAGKAATVAPIWRAALARCGEAWGDDQLALAAVIRPTLERGVEERPVAGETLRIRFLPVPGYNEAPDHVGHAIDALIVHFRGGRKVWMREWAHRHAWAAR
jgi:hypothetical protein